MVLRLDGASDAAYRVFNDCDVIFPAMFAAVRCRDRKTVKEVVSFASQVVWPLHVTDSVEQGLDYIKVLGPDLLSRQLFFSMQHCAA